MSPTPFPMTEERIRSLIDSQGWSWSLGRHRGSGAYEGCVFPRSGHCVMAEAGTPREALVEAFTKAMRAEPASGLATPFPAQEPNHAS